jgi:lipopolysaccharide export system permease protein
VEIINLDDQGNMSEYLHAEGFEIVSNEEWILHKVTRKTYSEENILSSTMETMPWKTFLNPSQISTLTKPQESLSPAELFRYVQHLQSTGQEVDVYLLALWKKLGGPLTMLGMLLLSVPFVFGSVRTGFANRLVMAGVTGITVYLLDQIFSNAGLILNLNPSFIALTPGLLLIWVARVWLRRVP